VIRVSTQKAADLVASCEVLARHVMPLVAEVFTDKFGKADLAVSQHYGDPRAILAAGVAELTAFIAV
jgi:hypothetical protein